MAESHPLATLSHGVKLGFLSSSEWRQKNLKRIQAGVSDFAVVITRKKILMSN